MTKFFGVVLTVTMIVIVFMVVNLIKVYNHDNDILGRCLNSTGTCSSTPIK